MGLVSIGPVSLFHGNPDFSWSAAPTSRSGQAASISGLTDWDEAHELRELIANPALQQTVGGSTGVLEWIEFDDDLLGPFTGYYLLTAFAMSPTQDSSVGGSPVAFSLSADFIGDGA